MKTKISITGQLNSVLTLKRAIQTSECKVTALRYNQFVLSFNTKKEAINALSSAYQHLKSDNEDWVASNGYYTSAGSLSYDAGVAVIKGKP